MRTILVIALAAVGLCACSTTEGQREAAALQCQSVGISQKDPQYDLCMRSYTLQSNQDALEVSYHRALNPTYDRRMAHTWHGF